MNELRSYLNRNTTISTQLNAICNVIKYCLQMAAIWFAFNVFNYIAIPFYHELLSSKHIPHTPHMSTTCRDIWRCELIYKTQIDHPSTSWVIWWKREKMSLHQTENFLKAAEDGMDHVDRWRSWWHHQMRTFSTLLALCEGIHRWSVDYPHKGQ